MVGRYDELLQALSRASLDGSATLDPAFRRAARDGGAGAGATPLPAALAAYVRKVADEAYKVIDEDVAALAAAGFTEDEIFEATVHAAVGAGLRRMDAGLRALRGVR